MVRWASRTPGSTASRTVNSFSIRVTWVLERADISESSVVRLAVSSEPSSPVKSAVKWTKARKYPGRHYSAQWKDLENELRMKQLTGSVPVMEYANQSKIGQVCVPLKIL